MVKEFFITIIPFLCDRVTAKEQTMMNSMIEASSGGSQNCQKRTDLPHSLLDPVHGLQQIQTPGDGWQSNHFLVNKHDFRSDRIFHVVGLRSGSSLWRRTPEREQHGCWPASCRLRRRIRERVHVCNEDDLIIDFIRDWEKDENKRYRLNNYNDNLFLFSELIACSRITRKFNQFSHFS